MNYWFFLGNPTVFDVNNEITEHADRLYWSTGNFSRKIVPGDRVFVWRSTVDPGVIAIGKVIGYPIRQQDLPEDVSHDNSTNLKVPLQLSETRLTPHDGLVSRNTVVNDEMLSSASIVTANTGSVHSGSCPFSAGITVRNHRSTHGNGSLKTRCASPQRRFSWNPKG